MEIAQDDYNEYNPFIRDYILKQTKKITPLSHTNLKLVDDKNKKVDGNVVYALETVREQASYIKMYKDFLPAFNKLSKQCQLIITFIIDEKVSYNSDRILITPAELAERELVSSKDRGYKIIRELKKNKFIASSPTPTVYYINILLFFKGDRRNVILNESYTLRK